MLQLEKVYAGYGKENIIHDISFTMYKGEFLCILGANGCGKTTLLKTILGLIKPTSGKIELNRENIHKMDSKTLAKKIAYIPQAHVPPFPFTVREVVLMGRTPYIGYLGSPKKADEEITDEVLAMLGLEWLAERNYIHLSGGQRQMVLVARALAQQPELLVMDEPTASLDFGNQYTVLNKVLELSKDGMGIIMVTHDPSHAFFCGDYTLTMQDGAVMEYGTPKKVIREDSMLELYKTRVKISDIVGTEGRKTSICVPVHTQQRYQCEKPAGYSLGTPGKAVGE